MYKGKRVAPRKLFRKAHKGKSRARHLTRKERERLRMQRIIGGAFVFGLCLSVPCGWLLTKFCSANNDQVQYGVSEEVLQNATETPLGWLIYSEEDQELLHRMSIAVAKIAPAPQPIQHKDPLDMRGLIQFEDLQRFPEVYEEAIQFEEVLPILAKIVKNEIGGLSKEQAYSTPQMEQAAVIWCILNRTAEYSTRALTEAATAPGQFAYNPGTPVLPEFLQLAEDVICRWIVEKHFMIGDITSDDILYGDVGRVLPRTYKYFGGDGSHNYFREEYPVSSPKWDWSYDDPYVTISQEAQV